MTTQPWNGTFLIVILILEFVSQMDDECDGLSELQQLEKDLSEMPTDDNDEDEDDDDGDDDDDDDEEEEEEEEEQEENDNISILMSLTDHKVEETPSSGTNGLDISVKLEVNILEDEENQNKGKDVQVEIISKFSTQWNLQKSLSF